MEKFHKSLAIYVAYLRAISIVHQNNHWTCKGPLFVQHHELFEKVYNSAQSDVDEAAEKIVGLFGIEILELESQSELIKSILDKVKGDDLIQQSLMLEEEFLIYSKKLYDILKTEEKDKLSLGLDDLIMEICSSREAACYHLKMSAE